MSSRQPIVEFRQVKKRFGNVEALRGISCDIPSGKVTALVGDNGAGKSTLIKIICGVHPPDTGEFCFEGQPAHWNNPDEARKAGVETVYQDLALVDSLSISRNFFLGKEPRRGGRFGPLDRDRMRKEALAGIASLGITLDDADRSVAKLSGGQRKSIAIVLEHVAEVRERGISVIFISHNLHLIYPVADRFLVLDQGKILADVDKRAVSPEDLIEAIIHSQPIQS